MSYILNAIRKSEQDRQTQEASNPESTLLETRPKQKPKLSWPMIVLLIMNILALIYFIFLYLQQQPVTVESQSPAITAPIQPEKQKIAFKNNVGQPKPKITLKNNVERPKPETTTKITPKPDQKKSISNMLKQRRGFTKPASKPVVEKVVTVAKNTNTSQPSTLLPAGVETKPTTAKQQPGQVVNKPKKTKKIPFLHEMAPSFRRNVPKLNINVFVYAKDPDDRFVIIDMKKYRTGQDTAEGLEIKEIKSNSLVLLYNNRTFQIERP